MNLNFSEEELQFQREVRQFLAANLPPHIIEGAANNGSVFVEKDIALQWQAILVAKGWAVAGLISVVTSPDALSTDFPLMKFCSFFTSYA